MPSHRPEAARYGERSEAIQPNQASPLDCFAALAMTNVVRATVITLEGGFRSDCIGSPL